MYKVMITGSAGFIYSNIVLYMLQHTDYKISGIDKLTYAGSRLNAPEVKRYKLHVGDVCDYQFVSAILKHEKPDIIIHGAAESFVDKSIESASDFSMTNVVGTNTMLEAALKVHTPKLFINVSSDEIYGQIKEGAFKETDILNPRNIYAATKASADLLGQAYFTTHGLPVITTRCCNVFGPRQLKEKLIPKCITNFANNEKIGVYNRGEECREWIYVKDVFNALQVIIENGKPGEVYNIGSGVERRNIDVVNFIMERMGKENLIEFVEDRKGHDFRYAVNTDKLKSIGWSGPLYEFEQALSYTIEWYLKNTWSWRAK